MLIEWSNFAHFNIKISLEMIKIWTKIFMLATFFLVDYLGACLVATLFVLVDWINFALYNIKFRLEMAKI